MMSVRYQPYPIPTKLRSIQQWLQAGIYTFYHGTHELFYLTAWCAVRNARKLYNHNNHSSKFKQYEAYLINRAEHYRHLWGHKFLDAFDVTCTIHHNHTALTDNKQYIVAYLNQQSIIELAVSAIASSNRSKCVRCNSNEFGVLPPHPFIQPFYLVNIEFSLIPYIGWCRGLAGVIIRRGNRKSTQSGMDKILKRMMTYNDTFLLSVEGQRSPTGDLATYKKGMGTQYSIICII